MITKKEILDAIHGKMIISCQAVEDEPLYVEEKSIMYLMARAAKQAGTPAIRTSSIRDVIAIKEETGLTISSYEFNDNEYYARTNTYINNYIVVVEDESFHCNEEVDYAKWYDLKDAMNIIKPDSLAQELLRRYLYKREHNLVFTR